jgi:tetratricopeptide (TPR) repeat protein
MQDNSYLCSFHIPKVGGTTFASHAGASLDADAFILHGPFSRVERFMHNQPQLEELPDAKRNAIQIAHGHGAGLALAEAMVGRLPEFMVVVRDPYERFVSGFHYHRSERKNNGLLEFSEDEYFERRGTNFYAKTLRRNFSALGPARGRISLQSLMPILRSVKYFILTERLNEQLAEISRRYGLRGGQIAAQRVNQRKSELAISREQFNERNAIDAEVYSVLASSAERSGGSIENPFGYDPAPLRRHLETVWSQRTSKERLSAGYDELVVAARKTFKLQALQLKLLSGSAEHVADKKLLLERADDALATWLPTLNPAERSAAEFWTGAMFMQDGRTGLAEDHFRKAVELNPRNDLALAHLAKVLEQRHDHVGAAERTEQAQVSRPERSVTQWLREALTRHG